MLIIIMISMGKVSNVLIFEYISGGGIENSEKFDFLISEGFGMLSALIEDFSRMGFNIHTLVDNRVFEQLTSLYKDLVKKKQITIAKINSSRQVNMIIENIIPNYSYIIFIAPESSNILHDLVKKAENLVSSEQIVLNLPSSAILSFSDKQKTESFFKSYKIPTPTTLNLTSQTISSLPSKDYIIKPRDGVGTSETYSITLTSTNRSELGVFLRQLLDLNPSTEFIIQEKVQGIPLSSFVAAFHGRMTYFTINSQEITFTYTKHFHISKLEYMGGTTPFTKIAPQIRSKLENVAKLICERFKLTGFFGLDFIYNAKYKSYSIIEVNPRITTPYIAISALFEENNSNILQTIFQKNKPSKIKGKKSFNKSEENKIELE